MVLKLFRQSQLQYCFIKINNFNIIFRIRYIFINCIVRHLLLHYLPLPNTTKKLSRGKMLLRHCCRSADNMGDMVDLFHVNATGKSGRNCFLRYNCHGILKYFWCLNTKNLLHDHAYIQKKKFRTNIRSRQSTDRFDC